VNVIRKITLKYIHPGFRAAGEKFLFETTENDGKGPVLGAY
jgi:hypothetical protein